MSARNPITAVPRLVRLAAASGLATTADTGVLYACCSAGWLSPGTAAILGCLIGGAVNFLLGRAWVFAVRGSWVAQAVRYVFVVIGGGALLSGAVVATFAAAGVPLLVAKGIAVFLVLGGWTYPMSARVVFRSIRATAQIRTQARLTPRAAPLPTPHSSAVR